MSNRDIIIVSILHYLVNFKYYSYISASCSVIFRQSLLIPYRRGMELIIPTADLSFHLPTSALLPPILGHQYHHTDIIHTVMKSNVCCSV